MNPGRYFTPNMGMMGINNYAPFMVNSQMIPKRLGFFGKINFLGTTEVLEYSMPKKSGIYGHERALFCYMPMTRNFNMCMKKQKLHRLCSKKILRIRRERRQKGAWLCRFFM